MPALAAPELSVPTAEPCAFASTRPLTREELLAAPVRWPRPGRLEQSLDAARRQAGGRPADARHRERGRAAGAPAARPPRGAHGRAAEPRRAGDGGGRGQARSPRGRCAAAGCARWWRRRCSTTRARWERRSSTSRGWWSVTARARACCCTGRRRQGGASRSSSHALGGELAAAGEAAGEIAHYPATEGVSSTQIVTMVREHRGALAEVSEPLPAAVRATEHLPDRAAALAAMHFPSASGGSRGGPRAPGVRGAADDAADAAAPPRAAGLRDGAAARRPRRERWRGAQRAVARGAAVPAHRRPVGGRWRRSTPTWRGRARCSAC